jgi:hypothetical protein
MLDGIRGTSSTPPNVFVLADRGPEQCRGDIATSALPGGEISEQLA